MLAKYVNRQLATTFPSTVLLKCFTGANVDEFDLGPIDIGKARRTGIVAGSDDDVAVMSLASAGSESDAEGVNGQMQSYNASMSFDNNMNTLVSEDDMAAAPAVVAINRRCKRKKRELLNVA